MKRRKFLQYLGLTASAPAVAKAVELVEPAIVEQQKPSHGFGLAPVKPEGSKVAYDYQQVSHGIITTGEHPKTLWPGVKEMWRKEYKAASLDFKNLFDK